MIRSSLSKARRETKAETSRGQKKAVIEGGFCGFVLWCAAGAKPRLSSTSGMRDLTSKSSSLRTVHGLPNNYDVNFSSYQNTEQSDVHSESTTNLYAAQLPPPNTASKVSSAHPNPRQTQSKTTH
jgi:hypothetical protein